MHAPADHPSLSLVVCTRDRAEQLRRCLGHVARAELPARFELVVVDNGSTDHTGPVVADHARTAPYPVVALCEPVPGLARARNRGAAAAGGAVLAFTDDDCLVERTHAARLAAAFAALPIGFASGRVLAAGEGEAPAALQPAASFRFLRPGRPVRPGTGQGANLAVRAAALGAVGGFDERLGAGTPFRCEDVDLVARLLAAGVLGAHLPGVVVRHAHGRDGAASAALERLNDRARGAFWAERLRSGERAYAGDWLRSAGARLGPGPRHLLWAGTTTARELAGAAGWVRAAGRVRPGALAG